MNPISIENFLVSGLEVKKKCGKEKAGMGDAPGGQALDAPGEEH